MWIVIHFLNEDTVEAVPETWFRRKEKMCAWPRISKKSKVYIEKKYYPDEINYEWFPARILGRKYGSYYIMINYLLYLIQMFIICLATLEEARSKSKKAQMLSDLSANEDKVINESKRQISSPPSLKQSKFILLLILGCDRYNACIVLCFFYG